MACVSPAPPFSPCFPTPTPAPQPRGLPPVRPPVAPGTVGFAQRAPVRGRPRFTVGVTPSRFRPALAGPGAAAGWVNRAWCSPPPWAPAQPAAGKELSDGNGGGGGDGARHGRPSPRAAEGVDRRQRLTSPSITPRTGRMRPPRRRPRGPGTARPPRTTRCTTRTAGTPGPG